MDITPEQWTQLKAMLDDDNHHTDDDYMEVFRLESGDGDAYDWDSPADVEWTDTKGKYIDLDD